MVFYVFKSCFNQPLYMMDVIAFEVIHPKAHSHVRNRLLSPYCCSAGGIGVLLHIDNLREMLLAAGAPSNLHIQGLMDSAWYAHDPENCTATALEDVRRKHCLDDSIITQMREGYR